MRVSVIRLEGDDTWQGDCWEGLIFGDSGSPVSDIFRTVHLSEIRDWAIDNGVLEADLPFMLRDINVRPQRERPAFMDQTRTLVMYHGSKTAHHGEHWSTIDWEYTEKDNKPIIGGDWRYVIFLDGGKTLRNVRSQSITFV